MYNKMMSIKTNKHGSQYQHNMDESILSLLFYTSIPAMVLIIGGVLSTFYAPGPTLRSVILHFAAGVVFSVVSLELLPDIMHEKDPLDVVIGFVLGIGVMLLLRRLTRQKQKLEGAPPIADALPIGLLFGVGVDLVIDGLLIGIGFAAGAQEGTFLMIAITVEVFALGLATSASMVQGRASRKRVIMTIVILALMLLISTIAGVTLLRGLSGATLVIILSFGLAALLFLVTEELLVEAHEEPETPWLTATFFAGFLLFLLLEIAK
ncbi:transporter [Pontibacter sp. E15-1]|uniref:ZIP family metal transporter n=1 Tax=Pontibacter sp. E15-1 TaxID=2919918 RepID=UPI001F4F3F80|nr:transporter [Pontibacter sp. E15-1]MCJ8167611.1 transporter [Pontibacter sp. E15-1]